MIPSRFSWLFEGGIEALILLDRFLDGLPALLDEFNPKFPPAKPELAPKLAQVDAELQADLKTDPRRFFRLLNGPSGPSTLIALVYLARRPEGLHLGGRHFHIEPPSPPESR